MKFFKMTLLAILSLALLSCATVQSSSQTTQQDFDAAWAAAIDTLPLVRFSASSTDKESGLIIADQSVVSGNGSVSRLNIRIEEQPNGTSITATFVPPPGTIGGYGIVDEYISELRKKLPDLSN